MNDVLKNALAVLGGIFIGIFVNASIIKLGNLIVDPVPGIDTSDFNSIDNNIHLFKFKHFLTPWIAHSIGTLIGAFIAAKYAADNQMIYAFIVGLFFLTGGLTMAYLVQGESILFNIADLGFAYIPMAWIGAKLAK